MSSSARHSPPHLFVGADIIRPHDFRRTKQEGMQEAVCVSKRKLTNFDRSRPLWAGTRRNQPLRICPPELMKHPK